MNRPKNQHWVPRFYLAQFATPETKGTRIPKVWVRTKEQPDLSFPPTNVEKVCAKRYLNSPGDYADERDWSLEEQFSKLESYAADFWPNLNTKFFDISVNSPTRGALAMFVASLYLRSLSTLNRGKDVYKRLVAAFEKMPKDINGVPLVDSLIVNDAVLKLDTSGWNEYKSWGEAQHGKFFVDMIRSKASEIREALLQKRWSVLVSDKPVFITSDNPVTVHSETGEDPGLTERGTIVLFPMSPTRLLYLDDTHSDPDGQYYPLQLGGEADLNLLIWRKAVRFMISHRNPDEVLREIRSSAESSSNDVRK